MTGRPCPGPCNVGLAEFLGYVAVALIAIALIWGMHAAARRVTGPNPRTGRLATIAFTGGTVLVTIVATMFFLQEVQRHAWPTVVLSERGTDPSDPIYLAGTYAVEWTAIGGQASCHLAATLRGADGNAFTQGLVDETIPIRTNDGGPATFVSVDRAAYYIDTDTDCPSWSITLTPQR